MIGWIVLLGATSSMYRSTSVRQKGTSQVLNLRNCLRKTLRTNSALLGKHFVEIRIGRGLGHGRDTDMRRRSQNGFGSDSNCDALFSRYRSGNEESSRSGIIAHASGRTLNGAVNVTLPLSANIQNCNGWSEMRPAGRHAIFTENRNGRTRIVCVGFHAPN